MGIFNNIDHELLKDILAEKLAGFKEEELKTPEERAELREQQKLDNDAAKIVNKPKAEGGSKTPKPQKLPDKKPVKLQGTKKTPEDFDVMGTNSTAPSGPAISKEGNWIDENPLSSIALGALAAGGSAVLASKLTGKAPKIFSD